MGHLLKRGKPPVKAPPVDPSAPTHTYDTRGVKRPNPTPLTQRAPAKAMSAKGASMKKALPKAAPKKAITKATPAKKTPAQSKAAIATATKAIIKTTI